MTSPPASSLPRRLWTASLALLLFLSTLYIGNLFLPRDKAITFDILGHDFLAFYTAGHFLAAGQSDRIYDLPSTRQFQSQIIREAGLEMGPGFGPFWNPPFYAWPFAPLSALPYRHALAIWWAISLLCLAASIILLMRLLPPDTSWQTLALVPLLILISLPLHQAFNHGQNTFTSLLLVSLTITFWLKAAANQNPTAAFFAGLIAGLLFYKPQLGAILALVMILHLGRRALLGLAITGTALLLLTLLTLPGLLETYLTHMPANLRWMQEHNSYLWERHITFKAFWRLLLQGHSPGPTSPVAQVLWLLCVLGLGAFLASAFYRTLHLPGRTIPQRRSATRKLIAATILSMPLLMPFYFDYDLLLMAIPAVLFAADLCSSPNPISPPDRRLIHLWSLFYVYLFFSSGLAGRSHLHLAVPLLTILALLHIRRCTSRQPSLSLSDSHLLPPLYPAA